MGVQIIMKFLCKTHYNISLKKKPFENTLNKTNKKRKEFILIQRLTQEFILIHDQHMVPWPVNLNDFPLIHTNKLIYLLLGYRRTC